MSGKKRLNKKKFIRFLIIAALLTAAVIIVFTPVLIKMNGEKKVEIGYGEEYEDVALEYWESIR